MTEYLRQAGLLADLEALRLPPRSATAARPASATAGRCRRRSTKAVDGGELVAAAVLSGNRNFEGRISPRRQGQLPGVAAAGRRLRAGRARRTSTSPTRAASARTGTASRSSSPTSGRARRRCADRRGARSTRRCSAASYGNVFDGRPDVERASPVLAGDLYDFEDELHLHRRTRRSSTGSTLEPAPLADIRGRARPGRSSATPSPPTTSRPPGTSPRASPAGRYLAGARASSRRTSTPTGRGAATTRS
ncbi:MAG: hypothetical protein MZV49_15680 [Rhodopseudomonas palustris]|nr:hypothetical protein [Rhodopseudomonas palustris]